MIPADTPRGLPNCGVVSCAMIAGVTHRQAWDALAQMQPGKGRGWRGRTFNHDRQRLLTDLGVSFIPLSFRRGPTLADFLRSPSYDPEGTYHLLVTGHVMTLHRGQLFDQFYRSGVPATAYPKQRKRVRGCLRITSGSPLLDHQPMRIAA